MAKKISWTTKRVKLKDLIEWNKNPVKISKRDAHELSKSIDKFDHVIPYVAAAPPNSSGKLPLLDGHQRKMIELQINKVPPDRVVDVRIPSRRLTDRERREIVVRLRKNTGEFDFDKLANNFDVPDLLEWGFSEKELQFEGFEIGESIDAEPQIDRAAELLKKWKVKTGDLWQIGEHRLLCGDSTKREDMERVMGGERAELFVTDPPYGVSYADKNRFLNAIGRPNSIEEPIENDHQTVSEMAGLWLSAFKNAYVFCDDGCAYYICSPQGGELMMMMMMMISDAGFLLKHSIIWVKNQFVIGRSDYHYKHEPLLYGWKKGGHKFYGDRGECSVWEISKPHDSNDHPTMKPVELFERAIKNSSQNGGVILDVFIGSGTTLVACENIHRKGCGIEISPAYCAVTLERMQTAFPAIRIERIEEDKAVIKNP